MFMFFSLPGFFATHIDFEKSGARLIACNLMKALQLDRQIASPSDMVQDPPA
jgi:hypothetical protein